MPRGSVDAWQEVARTMADLGARLGEHFKEVRQRAGEEQPPESRRAMAAALETLRREMGGAFESLAESMQDPVVRERALRASRALADAVEASVADLGDEVRHTAERFRNRGDR